MTSTAPTPQRGGASAAPSAITTLLFFIVALYGRDLSPGLHLSFLAPPACHVFILIYGLKYAQRYRTA